MLLVRGLLLLAQTEEPTPFSVAWFQLHKWDLGVTIAVAVVLTIVGPALVAPLPAAHEGRGRRRREPSTAPGRYGDRAAVGDRSS